MSIPLYDKPEPYPKIARAAALTQDLFDKMGIVGEDSFIKRYYMGRPRNELRRI